MAKVVKQTLWEKVKGVVVDQVKKEVAFAQLFAGRVLVIYAVGVWTGPIVKTLVRAALKLVGLVV